MRSDTVTKGMQQAPHRSLFNALGMTQEELDRPLIGSRILQKHWLWHISLTDLL